MSQFDDEKNKKQKYCKNEKSEFETKSFARYDREETELVLDNQRHLIKLHDTAGQEDYERLRQIIYKDVFTRSDSMCRYEKCAQKMK